MSKYLSFTVQEISKKHNRVCFHKVSPLILPITIFAGKNICTRLKIEKYGYQLLYETANENNTLLGFIVYDEFLPGNSIIAPLNIIMKLTSNISIKRINLQIFQGETQQKFDDKLLQPYLCRKRIQVYPRLPTAVELCIYLNQKSQLSSLIAKFFGQNLFIVSTKVQEMYFDISNVPDLLILKENIKTSTYLKRKKAQNSSQKYTNYLKIKIKGITHENQPSNLGFCLFEPTKTKIYIQKTSYYQSDDIITRIQLPLIYRTIFSTQPFAELKKRILPQIQERMDKKIILIKSDKSIGLSSWMHSIAQNTNYNFIKINCQKFITHQQLYESVKKCEDYGSSIIFIKNLAWLLEVQDGSKGSSDDIMKQIIRKIEETLKKMGNTSLESFIIVINFQRQQIRFDMTKSANLQIFQLSTEAKIQLLQKVCDFYSCQSTLKQKYSCSSIIKFRDKKQICTMLKNMIGWKKFYTILNNLRISEQSSEITITIENIMKQIAKFMDVQKVENIKNVGWDDVGGLHQAKQQIIQTILLPSKHPEIFDEWIKPRTGVLFYGPPGTGKTMLGKCIANECKMGFISIKGPELLNMYIGESEKNVREVFQRANSNKPCIIFMDELDALIPKRGQSSDSNQVMDRIVSELLSQMDQAAGNGIFVIGATNRPDLLDPSILRAGRFDKQIYLGILNDHLSRKQVLQAQTRSLNLKEGFDYQKVLQKVPQNFTGADFYGLTSKSIMRSAQRFIQRYESGLQTQQNKLTMIQDDFLETVATMKPSVTQKQLKNYEKLRQIYK